MSQASIIGGRTINVKDAPWQLLFLINDGTSVGLCGAVWLGGPWVLTAAHCVEDALPSHVEIYPGISARAQAVDSIRIGATQIIRHPRYATDGLKADYALLRLTKTITTPLAKPIKWVTPAHAKAGLDAPGKLCVATGWGSIDVNGTEPESLQSVTSVIYDTNATNIGWAGQGGNRHIGSCQGDSGGPLVVRDSSGTGWLVAGISSYIISFCGDPARPSYYSRVSVISSWIYQTTGIVSISPHLKRHSKGLLQNPFGNEQFTLSGKRIRLLQR